MSDVADDTGAPLEGADATNAFLGGAATVTPDADGRVRVIDSSGRFGSVEAGSLEGYLRENAGARLATAQERQDRLLQREYGEGIGNELKATGASLARALTLGGSDVIAGAIGGDEARTALRELSARNRIADATGTALGVAATALATGGAGGLARGLSATPAGLAMRGGAALSELGAGAGVLGRAGAMAAGGALEGAALGAGEGVTDWALNPEAQERTAERLMASMTERAGQGALLGGLAAGGLSLGASALGAGAKKAKNALSGLFGKGTGTVDDAAAGGLSLTTRGKTSATLADDLELRGAQRGTAVADDTLTAELEVGKTLGPDSPLKRLAEGATARQKFAARQQAATESVSRDITEMNRTAEELFGRTAGVEMKRPQIAKRIAGNPPANFDVTSNEAVSLLSKIDDELVGALEIGEREFQKSGLRAFREIREDITQIASGLRMARNADDAADLFIGLDKLKRRLGQEKNAVMRGMSPDNGANAIIGRQYNDLMRMLEADELWGSAAATMQRENNSAISSYLDFARAFDDRFALAQNQRTTRGIKDPFGRVADADTSKVGAALSGIGKAESEVMERTLLEGSKRQAEMLETLARNYDLSAAQLSKVAAARKAANRIASEASELKRLRVVGDKFDDMMGALSDIPGIGGQLAKLKISTGRALSLAMEGQAAAKSRKVLDVATEQGAEAAVEQAMERMTAMQRLYIASEGVGQKIATAAQKYARTFGAASTRALAGTASASGTRADRQTRYQKAYAAVSDFDRDPQAAIRRAFRTQHSLGTVAPVLASAYAAKTIQAGSFLVSKLPTKDPASAMFQKDDGSAPKASDNETREFLEYVDAIEQPLVIFDQLEKGRVSPRTVEAIKTVYPRLYEDIQSELMRSIQDEDKTPPYKARLQLGILFDVPTDPALQPDYLQLLQRSALASTTKNSPDGGMLSPSQRSAPDTAELYESQSAAAQKPL